MPIDATRFVAQALNRGDDKIMDRALETRGLPSPGPASWIVDRFGFLATAVVTPWKRRLAPASPLAGDAVVYDVSVTESYRQHRRSFVRRHFGEDVDFVGRWEERVPAHGRGPWMRWYWLGVFAAIMAFADWSSRRHRWLGGLLLDVQSFARALPGTRRAYVFGLHDRRPYLIATYLAKHTRIEVVPVFQNIPLYRNCRYFHLGVPVVLTSRVNVPEVEYYGEQGIFLASMATYAGGEYASDTSQVLPAGPVFDIGFFSSGEWARAGGLYQTTDIEAVRRGDFADNAYARQAEALLEALATHVRTRGLTLRIYPHPMERRLMNENGIQPPYARLDDGGEVTIDRDGGDSRSKVHEARVAISLQSSFVWERLDLGIEDTFVFAFADQDMNAFLPESLGRYRSNVFTSEADMLAKADAALGLGA
jgi:hypothetical protein